MTVSYGLGFCSGIQFLANFKIKQCLIEKAVKTNFEVYPIFLQMTYSMREEPLSAFKLPQSCKVIIKWAILRKLLFKIAKVPTNLPVIQFPTSPHNNNAQLARTFNLRLMFIFDKTWLDVQKNGGSTEAWADFAKKKSSPKKSEVCLAKE